MMQSLMAKTHQVCWPACALPSVALCGVCLAKSASAVKCWWLLGQECICLFLLCCCALAGEMHGLLVDQLE